MLTLSHPFLPVHTVKFAIATSKLTGTIPLELTRLPKLDTLILSELHLNGTIPATVGDMTNLGQSTIPQVVALLL